MCEKEKTPVSKPLITRSILIGRSCVGGLGVVVVGQPSTRSTKPSTKCLNIGYFRNYVDICRQTIYISGTKIS
jgi:hypothetical protein